MLATGVRTPEYAAAGLTAAEGLRRLWAPAPDRSKDYDHRPGDQHPRCDHAVRLMVAIGLNATLSDVADVGVGHRNSLLI